MKIRILSAGKIDVSYLREGIALYDSRLKHYATVELTQVNLNRSDSRASVEVIKAKETELLMKKINPGDFVVMLHEHGKQLRSLEMAALLNEHMVRRTKKLVFVIGGPHGFSEPMFRRADLQLSLSSMTFPHQLVKLVFLEQLYRAFTIIKNEPYHNE
ncbi:MAG: 23S rRNA (pseudouridine(1915)-N(3))-methyltransferase RlmH [Bacteroidales bacterium]|nr:23S rRNA (pseudouridine(1915)-N(3))-methyltransferase RlmH [Bacteroidales bacterium]MDZ4203381.1 23S rRNA (pseudouridine(1915)-N(3))-methyltransferase RlmH [Bacteroidales bacterium]